MGKARTIAQELGIRPKRLASKTRTALARARKILEAVGYEWSEIDSGYAAEIDDLYCAIGKLQGETLDQSIDHLSEPMEDLYG